MDENAHANNAPPANNAPKGKGLFGIPPWAFGLAAVVALILSLVFGFLWQKKKSDREAQEALDAQNDASVSGAPAPAPAPAPSPDASPAPPPDASPAPPPSDTGTSPYVAEPDRASWSFNPSGYVSDSD
jgi:type IV secretory pathway VirB10-like protein